MMERGARLTSYIHMICQRIFKDKQFMDRLRIPNVLGIDCVTLSKVKTWKVKNFFQSHIDFILKSMRDWRKFFTFHVFALEKVAQSIPWKRNLELSRKRPIEGLVNSEMGAIAFLCILRTSVRDDGQAIWEAFKRWKVAERFGFNARLPLFLPRRRKEVESAEAACCVGPSPCKICAALFLHRAIHQTVRPRSYSPCVFAERVVITIRDGQ